MEADLDQQYQSSSRRYRYFETDVFTSKPGYGNPVAIVIVNNNTGEDSSSSSASLSTESMQRFANWTNFSETTFVTHISSDKHSYNLRIFTPFCELPFAGHPSVGTAQTLLQHGFIIPNHDSPNDGNGDDKGSGGGTCIQHCGVGALPLKVVVDNNGKTQQYKVSIRVPYPKITLLDNDNDDHDETKKEQQSNPSSTLQQEVVGSYLKSDWIGTAAVLDVGPKWLVVQMISRSSLNTIPVQLDQLQVVCDTVNALGITAYAIDSDDSVWVRSICPEPGVMEDPVCGSGNGTVGYHRLLLGNSLDVGQSYVARQGEVIGRDGYVYVDATTTKSSSSSDEDESNSKAEIWIGGYAQIVVDGYVTI